MFQYCRVCCVFRVRGICRKTLFDTVQAITKYQLQIKNLLYHELPPAINFVQPSDGFKINLLRARIQFGEKRSLFFAQFVNKSLLQFDRFDGWSEISQSFYQLCLVTKREYMYFAFMKLLQQTDFVSEIYPAKENFEISDI